MLKSRFIKAADLKTCHFIEKETPAQVFSCGICEIFKNILFKVLPIQIALTLAFERADFYGIVEMSIVSAFSLRPTTLLKKRLWHMCFPENFAKFLRTPFLYNTSG